MRHLILFLIPFLMFGQGKATHGSSLSSTAVTVTDNHGFRPRDVLSFGGWYRLSKVDGTTDRYLIRKTSAYIIFMTRTYTNTGAWLLFVGGTSPQNKTFLNPALANGWNFIVMTYDSLSRTAKTYLNGDSLEANIFTGLSYYGMDTSTNNVIIENASNGGNDYKVSECFIYHRVLGTSEIKWIYRHPGKLYSIDSLKGYWKFNEYVGTFAGDSSGNGNSGTISNGIWSFDTPVKSGGN